MSIRGCRDPEMSELLGAYELGLLSGSERSRVEDHLLHCNECFEDLYETATVGRLVLENTTRVRAGRKRWFLPAVAAATLVLAFAATMQFVGDRPEVMRGSHSDRAAISLLGPRGATQGSPIHFRWQSPESVKNFILVVFNEGGDSIWSLETVHETVDFDIEQGPLFEPHHIYYWKVMGNDEAGRLVAVSPVHSFFIETD